MRFIVVVAALALAGCATPAQRQVKRIVSDMKVAAADIHACLQNVYDDPAFSSLRVHRPMLIKDATLEQMLDKSRVTPAEVPLLSQSHAEATQCREAFVQHLERDLPLAVPGAVDAYEQDDKAILDLAQQKTTWGEYVMRVKEIDAEAKKRFLAAIQQTDAQLKAENRYELQQRQAALAASAQFLQNEQAINAMNRPVMTNCNTFGNSVSCYTH